MPEYSSIYETAVDRIKSSFSSCSKVEQNLMLKILEEMADKGYSYTLETIWLADFKEIPVGIDQFLDDPYYLGPTNDFGNAVYPFWRKTLREIFSAGNKYNEILLSGATRLGKSTTCTTMMAYMLYKLMLYRDPHAYFHKKAVSRFTVAFANLTKNLAFSVAYREFNDTLKDVPFFQDHGSFTRSDRNYVYLPEGGKIDIVAGSDAAQFLGMQIWCLTGDTEIYTCDGVKTLAECSGTYQNVLQYLDGHIVPTSAQVAQTSQASELIEIELADGTIIKGTPDHRLMLSDGTYKRLRDIEEGDDLMEVEQWKEIEGTSEYLVSNFGRIKRLEHTIEYVQYGKVRTRIIPEQIMKGSFDGDGYPTVQLKGLGGRRIHRLVASAFVDNPDNKEIVNHKDGNKTNNLASNLEWVTSAENTYHFWHAECFKEARELHKQRQSAAQKGHTHVCPEHVKAALSIANRAENLPPERRKKISEGLKGRRLSKDSRKKIGAAAKIHQKGVKFINNGTSELRVRPDEIDKYLSQGWNLGRISRIWINDGIIEKQLCSTRVDSIPEGWKRGRLCK